MTGFPIERRNLLRTIGASAVGTSLAGQSTAAESVAEGPTVYIGSLLPDTLYAVDADDGTEQWTFDDPSGDVKSSPTVETGGVFVGSDDATLYAVIAETGAEAWAFTEPSNRVGSSPTVIDGTVYVGCDDETLYAVDAYTGTQEWAFTEPSGRVSSSPTVVDGTVYVGSNDNTLYAVDAETGEQEWAFTKPSDWVWSSPTVADGSVYVGSHDDTLYAVDAATGTQEWAFTQPSDAVRSSPTVMDGMVYVGSDDNTLYAVNAFTGTEEWAFTEPSDDIESSPTIADGTVYVVSGDSTLYAVDAATGSEEWAFTTDSGGGSLMPSPTVWDGTVYFADITFGRLYAVDATTGTEQWDFSTSGFFSSSPTVVPDPDSARSEGSRVNFGTLGHHDGWDGTDPGDPGPAPPGLAVDYEPGTVAPGDEVTFEATVEVETTVELDSLSGLQTDDEPWPCTDIAPDNDNDECSGGFAFWSDNESLNVTAGSHVFEAVFEVPEDSSTGVYGWEWSLLFLDDQGEPRAVEESVDVEVGDSFGDVREEKLGLAERLSPEGVTVELDERDSVVAVMNTLEEAIGDDISEKEAAARVERLIAGEEMTDAAATVAGPDEPRDSGRPDVSLAQAVEETVVLVPATIALNTLVKKYVASEVPDFLVDRLSEFEDFVKAVTKPVRGEPEGIDDLLTEGATVLVQSMETGAVESGSEALDAIRTELAERGYARNLRATLEQSMEADLEELNQAASTLTGEFELDIEDAADVTDSAVDEIYELADDAATMLDEFTPAEAVTNLLSAALDILESVEETDGEAVGETDRESTPEAIISIPALIAILSAIYTAVKTLGALLGAVATIDKVLSLLRGRGALAEIETEHGATFNDITALEEGL